LLHGDCLKVMKRIPDGSVDMILSDPPYGKLRLDWDSIIPIEPMWEQLKRVIKLHGAIVMTATQPFTTILISSNLKMFKYCWVWVKTNSSGYQMAKIKPLSRYEDIVVFGNGRIVYYPQMVLRDKPRSGMIWSTSKQIKISGGGVYRVNKTYTHRYPTTVIEVGNVKKKGIKHSTQKPVALMGYLIETYTREDEVVLDFAMGSGTTGVACKNLGRKFIGIDTDLGCVEMARKRIKEECK